MHNPFDVQHRPYRGCRATTTRAVSCLHTGLNGPSLLLELIRIVHLQTFPIVITHMAHSRQTSQTAFSVKRECEAATACCIYKTLPPVLVTGPLSPHLPLPSPCAGRWSSHQGLRSIDILSVRILSGRTRHDSCISSFGNRNLPLRLLRSRLRPRTRQRRWNRMVKLREKNRSR